MVTAGSAPGTMATPLSRENLAAANNFTDEYDRDNHNRLRNRNKTFFKSSLSKLFQVKGWGR